MKVGLVCDWYHPRVGGIELHLQDLAKQLAGAGHDVVVVTPTPGPDDVDGIRVRRTPGALMPVFEFLCTGAGIRAVGNALTEEKVDVAHCHVSIVSPAALGGACQAHRRGIPTVLTFHSVVPQTHLLARAVRMTLGTAAWRARFTAVSKRVAGDVSPIAAGSAVTVLPNGIDVGFWRVERTRTDSEFRMVSVMRLNGKKRPLALVDMMKRLRSMLPADERVSLRIVGDGPQRPMVQRAIERANLGDRVELLGRKTREEIRELLREADVFVLPTVRESFGLAALEARCVGLPVVAMAQSGVSELITHRREGLLARSDQELAAHVLTLVREHDLRRGIAANNRTTSPAHDWPNVIEQHLSLYGEAIALRATV